VIPHVRVREPFSTLVLTLGAFPTASEDSVVFSRREGSPSNGKGDSFATRLPVPEIGRVISRIHARARLWEPWKVRSSGTSRERPLTRDKWGLSRVKLRSEARMALEPLNIG
jgi:hypothetical protein